MAKSTIPEQRRLVILSNKEINSKEVTFNLITALSNRYGLRPRKINGEGRYVVFGLWECDCATNFIRNADQPECKTCEAKRPVLVEAILEYVLENLPYIVEYTEKGDADEG